jgi:endoglucanase
VDTKRNAKTAHLGWGAPLLAIHLGILLAAAPACVMPGQTPAVGGAGETLASCGADGLIDDCEDNNNQSKVVEGRGGYWYTFADEVGTTVVPEAGAKGGTFTMSPGGVNGSKYAANVRGQVGHGQVVFGAMGVNLVDPKNPYDASQYKGVAFWAKKGPGSYGKVRFKVPDISTDGDGGICTDCFNDFGAEITLSESWQHFVFTWRKLRQLPDWGAPKPKAIKPDKLFGLQWQINKPGAVIDMWVDDVEFVGCE